MPTKVERVCLQELDVVQIRVGKYRYVCQQPQVPHRDPHLCIISNPKHALNASKPRNGCSEHCCCPGFIPIASIIRRSDASRALLSRPGTRSSRGQTRAPITPPSSPSPEHDSTISPVTSLILVFRARTRQKRVPGRVPPGDPPPVNTKKNERGAIDIILALANAQRVLCATSSVDS